MIAATFPDSDEIEQRIQSCREELDALLKLRRMTKQAKRAETERTLRRQRKAVAK